MREGAFFYPLHNKSRMSKFEAIIQHPTNFQDKKRIRAKIEELEQAKQMFQQAKNEERAAVLTTLDKNATDVFKVELGSIPDNYQVVCKFEYFLELNSDGAVSGMVENKKFVV